MLHIFEFAQCFEMTFQYLYLLSGLVIVATFSKTKEGAVQGGYAFICAQCFFVCFF